MKIKFLKESLSYTSPDVASEIVMQNDSLRNILHTGPFVNETIRDSRNTNLNNYFYSYNQRDLNILNSFIPANYPEHNTFTPKFFINKEKHAQFLQENKNTVGFYYKNEDSSRFLEQVLPRRDDPNHSIMASFYSAMNSTLLYAKSNHIGTHADGTEIYSQFNKNFFISLDLEKISLSSNSTFDPSTLTHNSNTYLKSIGSTRNSAIFFNGNHDLEFPKISYKTHYTSRSNCYSSSINNIPKGEFFSLPENVNKDKFTIFHIPSWNSKTEKEPLWREATLSFASKRKGVFIPTYNKSFIIDEDLNVKEIYMLVMNLIAPDDDYRNHFYNRITSYTNSAKAFSNFLTKYFFEDCLFFKDREAFNVKIKEKYSSFNPYLDASKVSTAPSFINFVDSALSFKENFNPFEENKILPPESVSILASSPKENLSIKKKLKKLNLRYQKYLQGLNELKEFSKNNLIPLFDYSLVLHKIKLKTIKKPFSSTIPTFDFDSLTKSKTLHNSLSKKNSEYIMQSIESGELEKDQFLMNLIHQHIYLMEVHYYNGVKFTPTQSVKLDHFVLNTLYSEKIKSVTFLIDKPVPIYVDSKQNPRAVKVGGPYIVDVTQNNLKIALKDSNSLYGINSSNVSVKPHPHSNTINTQNLSAFSSACLGEAAPLIYSAFSNNCLKTIIVSAMTWVTSANSADPWGKTYTWFLDYSLVNQQKQSSEDITDEEVDSFLSFAEEQLEENPEAELTPVSPELPSTEQIPYQPYYTVHEI